MPSIEVKADFKAINIKDKTVMQFELSPYSLSHIPDLTKLVGRVLFLKLDDEQQELPIEEVEAEYEQPEIPVDDVPEEEPYEVEYPELPEPALPEPGEGDEAIEEASDEGEVSE